MSVHQLLGIALMGNSLQERIVSKFGPLQLLLLKFKTQEGFGSIGRVLLAIL